MKRVEVREVTTKQYTVTMTQVEAEIVTIMIGALCGNYKGHDIFPLYQELTNATWGETDPHWKTPPIEYRLSDRQGNIVGDLFIVNHETGKDVE